jgi:hypothetical protein
MLRKVRTLQPPPMTLNELSQSLIHIWNNINRLDITNLILGMRRRCQATRFQFFQQMDEFLGSQPSNSSPHFFDVQRINEHGGTINNENPEPCCSKNLDTNSEQSSTNEVEVC